MNKIGKTPDYNLCNIIKLAKRKENSIVQTIFKQLVETVNISNISCPIRKGRIIFKNFHLDGSRLPSFIPSGQYYTFCNMLTIENGVKIVIFSVGTGVKFESL